MIRLFIALIIPDEVKNQVIEIRKRIFPDEGIFRWEDNSKVHLTLKFIGEVKEDLLESIINELNFLEHFNKINCSTEGFGFFFKAKDEPRILWLGLDVDSSINRIVEELNQRLSKFSIPIEHRKFKAHLTLLRIKKSVPKDFIEKFSNTEFHKIKFTASEIDLMQSELSSQGSTYKEIKKYYLK
jgi:RNA 2',3'-cyclic 3'-phosphodiesterase